MAARTIRYQGAILKNDHILLVRALLPENGLTFWLLPGGGIEDGETEEECVVREIKEETGFDVSVECLLYEEQVTEPDLYKSRKTFLCRITGGQQAPGIEPEADLPQPIEIAELGWFDLRNESSWYEIILKDERTLSSLHNIQQQLGIPSTPGE